MKIGRNEPCPCGSGKKYKKCCLNKEKPPESLLWHSLGKAYDKLQDQLLDYARKAFGELALPMAMDDFLLWPEEENPIELIKDHMTLFIPWFLFEWDYDPFDADVELPAPVEESVASAYLDAHGSRLDRLEQKLIKATLDQPFSFYEVMNCRPGQGYRLKDILRGIETDVYEKLGSENARPGDILLCRVVQVDEVAILIGCSSILIPPDWKPEIIDLKNIILEEYSHITAQVLQEYDLDIRETYLYIYDAAMAPPQLCNTDGDPLLFQTLLYEIDAPETAFQRLFGLCTVEDEETLRSMATLDEGGRVIKAEIPWSRPGHKKSNALDNTILGRIMIDHHNLLIEVNSEARAEVAGKEMEVRLGEHAKYLTTEIQSPETMPDGETLAGSLNESEQDELMQLPEVREHMAQLLTHHWEGWIDQELPALGGKTPRHAVKTPDGKESVEALLLSASRHMMSQDDEMSKSSLTAIETVRRRLGLNKVSGTDAEGVGEDKTNEVSAIDSMIEAFGSKHLDTLYTDLAFRLRQMIAGNRQLSLQRGRKEIWAAAIIYAIAQLNFLFDPETEPCILPDDICEFFGTKKTTVSNKAGIIRKELDLYYGHPDVCSPDLVSSFSFYETPEGFIIPGSLVDKTISPPEFGAEYDAPIKKKDLNNRRQPKKQIQKNSMSSKKEEESNCNQLNLFDDLSGENKMDLKTLQDRPSWEWPEGAGKMLVKIFSDDQADASDRLLAVELASDFVVISDDLIEGLLSILCNGEESDEIRRRAAISMGPALEYSDTDGFDDLDDDGISEGLFDKVRDTLRELYMDTGVPKEVRRRVLEASVRAPQEWHQDAIHEAYSSDDESWRLTAVFCMQFVRGFEGQILEALNSENEDIHYESVCAAGNWEVDAAWEHITGLVASEEIDKELLLAAIETVPNIRPQEAGEVLGGLLDSDDEDIVDAAYEAISMAEMFLDLESDEDEFL